MLPSLVFMAEEVTVNISQTVEAQSGLTGSSGHIRAHQGSSGHRAGIRTWALQLACLGLTQPYLFLCCVFWVNYGTNGNLIFPYLYQCQSQQGRCKVYMTGIVGSAQTEETVLAQMRF